MSDQKRQLGFMLRDRKEHKKKSTSMQALDKEPGTEKRPGLEEAWVEGSFHSKHHGHSRAPSYSEQWKQLGFLICQFSVVNMDPLQADLPGL